MTHDEWEHEWEREFFRLRREFPTARLEVLQKAARKVVIEKFGGQPPKDPTKPPLKWRVGIAVARKVTKEMNMSPMMFRIVNALLFFLGAFVAAIQVSKPESTEQWVSAVVSALIAAYGKYSSNQTFLAPNRPVWTDEQRAAQEKK